MDSDEIRDEDVDLTKVPLDDELEETDGVVIPLSAAAAELGETDEEEDLMEDEEDDEVEAVDTEYE